MKKTLLLFAMCMSVFVPLHAETTDVSSYDNLIYVETATIPAGSEYSLSVKMKNTSEMVGFQFRIYLPDGISFNGAPTLSNARTTAEKTNTFETTNEEDGSITVIANSTKGEVIEGNDGEIVLIPVTVSSDADQGELTLTLKDVRLGTINAETIKIEEDVKTTITVTEPLGYDVLLDETSTTAPEAATNKTVLVKRTLVSGWNTICLPFAMTADQLTTAFGSDVKLADFAGYNYDSENDAIKVSFNSVTALEANHPYIINVSKAFSEFKVENVDIAPSSNLTNEKGTKKVWSRMTGTYIANTTVDKSYLFLNGGKFYYSNGATKMKAFRAYFDFYDELKNRELAKSRIAFSVGNGTTDISTNELRPAITGKVYSLSGQEMGDQMEGLPKGVYIKDGKKVVKK